ncbi:unnamed protein product [Ectocarpus sp. 4 AP-2014]
MTTCPVWTWCGHRVGETSALGLCRPPNIIALPSGLPDPRRAYSARRTNATPWRASIDPVSNSATRSSCLRRHFMRQANGAHRLRLKLPLLFKLVNTDVGTRRIMGTTGPSPCQFCGVLEFSAPEYQVFLPYWLMQNLLLSEGGRVELRSILRPPAGSFVRFKPHDESFLGAAAKQGPKALMEDALRRYSVLSEGATILHEGDNFFLDVVELRTFDSSPATIVSDGGGNSPNQGSPSAEPRLPRNGTPVGTDNDNDDITRNGVSNHDDNDGDRSPYSDAGRRVRQDDSGSPCGEAGRRVRLVGLLGDLDLEVEFCSPHAPLPPSPSQHSGTDGNGHNATRRGPADEGSASIGEVSREPARCPTQASSSLAARPPPPSSSDQVFADKDYLMESGVGPPLSLPAPATAKRSSGDDRSAGSGLEPSLWRAGHLGRKPPVPPSSRYSSRVSKRQPFSGKGMSLSGGMATATPNPGNGVATSRREDQSPEAGEAPPAAAGAQARAVGIRSYSEEDVEPPRGSSVGRRFVKEAVESRSGSGDRCPRRVVVDRLGASRKSAFSPPGTNEAREAVERRVLGTGALVASTASSAVGTRGDGGATETESSRGQRSFTGDGGLTGVRLAEASSAAAMVTSTCGSCGKLVPAANQQLHALRCRPSSSTAGRRPRRGGGAIPPPDDAPPVAAAEQPRPAASKQDTAAREFAAAAAAAAVAASPVSPFTCAYCGLSFRTTIAAGDHETLCAARTERCGRCCGLVPRGDAEAHRRPGGGCDAAISAAAKREEAQAVETVVAGGGRGGVRTTDLGLVGSVGSVVGGAEPSGRFNGHLDPGTSGGRFDALLAEALSSSKAATAVLADARAENAARMAAGAGSPTGTGADSRSNRDGGGGGEHGSCVERGSVSGNEAATLAVSPAPVGSGGPTPSTEPGADISMTTPGEGPRYERPSPRQFGVWRGTDGEEEEEDGGAGIAGHLSVRPWTCSRCTLLNPRHAEACEACGSTVWSEDNGAEKQTGGEGTARAGTKLSGAFETPPGSVNSLETPAMGVVAPAEVGDAESVRPPHSERSSSPNGVMPRAAEAAAGGVAVSRARFLRPQVAVVVEQITTSLRASRAEPHSPPPAGAVPGHGQPSGLDGTRGAGGLGVNHGARSTAMAATAAGERGVVRATSPSAGRGEALPHPLPPRRNTALVVPENMNALQQQQQHHHHHHHQRRQEQQQQQWHRRRRGENVGVAQRANRRVGGNRQQQGGRRRPGRHLGARRAVTMGPPRRLGGIHRPSPMMRLSSLSPSLSVVPPDVTRPVGPVAAGGGASAVMPPTASAGEEAMSAALASSGARPGGSGMDRRHGHRLPFLVSSSAPLPLASSGGGSGLDSGGGGRGRRAGGGSGGGSRRRRDAGGNTSDVSRRVPPDPGSLRTTPPIAPACDISLSILGRRSSQGRVGLEPGEVATEIRPPRTVLSANEVSLVAPLQRMMRDAGGGGGVDVAVGWGKRDGGRVRAGVGIAPSKLRRRVSDTRLLEPL